MPGSEKLIHMLYLIFRWAATSLRGDKNAFDVVRLIQAWLGDITNQNHAVKPLKAIPDNRNAQVVGAGQGNQQTHVSGCSRYLTVVAFPVLSPTMSCV